MDLSGFLLSLFLNAILRYITFLKCLLMKSALLPRKSFVSEGACLFTTSPD